jgi:type IV pilus assembly protein PilC
MAEFTYTAITKDGHRESGALQAPSLVAAGHLLKEQGMLPTQIEEKHGSSVLGFLKSISTVSLAEKINIIDNLGVMLKAGISISRALQILVKQTKNAKLKVILADIYTQVQGGKSLGDALASHPHVFSNIFVSMVKVGELSGNLDNSLAYLGVQLHREADLKSKVKGAMIYPSVIMGVMIIIGILMSIFVLPKLTSIFKEFDTNLPLITRIVISIADFMSAHGFMVIAGLIAIIFGLVTAYQSYQGKKIFHTLLLHFFIINTIIKKINLARFARILSSLLKSGIPFVQGLEVASQSLSNIPYKELVGVAAGEVKLGKSLADSLGKNDVLFPVLVIQMLQVGEESGTVEDILGQLAAHYEEEVDSTLRNLSSIIEPLLLLFIGGIVGVLAMALISPIYNISENIK